MLKFLRWVKICFWSAIFCACVFGLVIVSTLEYNSIPPWEEISQPDNISSEYSGAHHAAIRKSRSSAVLVKSANIRLWSSTSTMTGTYFIANNKHYVITVDHGIHGPCWLVTIRHADEDYNCKEFVAMDEENDYVIMEMEGPIGNRHPIRIPEDLPHGIEWKPSYSILNNIIYTGYPNTIGPLTLRGDVIGYGDEYLYVFSHAYGGASGSGIFTHEGKYIGYIVAIDVGATEWGPDVLENIVIVAPTFNVDWSAVLD